MEREHGLIRPRNEAKKWVWRERMGPAFYLSLTSDTWVVINVTSLLYLGSEGSSALGSRFKYCSLIRNISAPVDMVLSNVTGRRCD